MSQRSYSYKQHLENIAQYISLNWKCKMDELYGFLKGNTNEPVLKKAIGKILEEVMNLYTSFGEIIKREMMPAIKKCLVGKCSLMGLKQ